MSAPTISNVKFDDDKVTIFGWTGKRLSTDKLKITTPGSELLLRTTPVATAIWRHINQLVISIAGRGEAHQLNTLLISPLQALTLHFANHISRPSLIHSAQGDGYADIYESIISGLVLTLRITPHVSGIIAVDHDANLM